MFESLRPYPSYKDSGSPWLGEVPESWALVRMKALLQERNDKGYADLPLLAATQSKGVVRKEAYENRTVVASKDLHLLKLVREGDFVISLRSFQGGIEYAHDRGIISPAYTILFPTDADHHAYLAGLFKSHPFIENLSLYVTGIREGQNIDYEKLGRSQIPLPPAQDRAAIVRFLSFVDRRTRAFVQTQQAHLRLLEEQKQALIYRAVSKGLVEEGLEALGSTPDQLVNRRWRVSRLKSAATLRTEKGHPEMDLLSVFLGRGVIPYAEGGGQVHKPSLDLSGYQVVHPGDLVLNNQQAWRGSVGVSSHAGIISPAYVVLELDDVFDQRFARYLFASQLMILQYVTASKGVGDIQRDLYLPWLMGVRVPVPPLDEQVAIVDGLDLAVAELERRASLVARQVSLVREYRTRLIADVAAGRVDVRDAAAHLPGEVDLGGQAQTADTLLDADEPDGELAENDPSDELGPAVATGPTHDN